MLTHSCSGFLTKNFKCNLSQKFKKKRKNAKVIPKIEDWGSIVRSTWCVCLLWGLTMVFMRHIECDC